MMKPIPPGMKKYYIGLAVLFIFSVAVTLFVASQAGDAKKDKLTTEKFDAIANKLDERGYSGGAMPESLNEIGIKGVPSTITYKKLDEEKYRLCTTYLTEANIFDAGWLALLGGGFAGGQPPAASDDEDTPKDYLDRTQSYYHKKGQTCQTVIWQGVIGYGNNDPGIDSGSASNTQGQEPYCYKLDSGYTVNGAAIVESIDITTKTITLNPIDTSTTTEVTYDDSTAVYTIADCKATEVSLIAPGSVISYYGFAGLAAIDVIEVE